MPSATLGRMKIATRRRLGELVAGTYGNYRYEGQLDMEDTDEVGEALNEAQAYFARDLYEPNTYLFQRWEVQIPVVPGVRSYTLQDDHIAVDECWHVRQSVRVQMHKQSIKDKRHSYERSYTGGFYHYYEDRGMGGVYRAQGVAESGHEVELHDTRGNFGSRNIRVGDRVLNITDDSEGVVESFMSGILTANELFGGRVNAWRRGDKYAIASAEEDRFLLLVYPILEPDQLRIYTGGPVAFELDAAALVDLLEVRFSELPDDYEADERITFEVVDEHGGLADVREGHESYTGMDDVRVGWQELPTTAFQLEQNIAYTVNATRENGSALTVAEVRLTAPSTD